MNLFQSDFQTMDGLRHEALSNLAKFYGVELEYVDGRNKVHHATNEILLPVLRALNPLIQPEQNVQNLEDKLKQESLAQFIEPVLLYYPQSRRNLQVPISLPVGEQVLGSDSFRFQFFDEKGRCRQFTVPASSVTSREGKPDQEATFCRLSVSLPFRPAFGYYVLQARAQVENQSYESRSFLISAPRRCYEPSPSRKKWGVGMQLYGVKSAGNWGIGDLGDLKQIIKVAGKKWRADTIGLQPLHAPTPGLASPYSPSSRLFWNPVYLDLKSVEEFRQAPSLTRRFRTKKFQQILQFLREAPRVEYEKISDLKTSVLFSLYRQFLRQHLKPMTSRGRTFLRFYKEGGAFLRRFCTFQALFECFGKSTWREWPEEYRHPDASAVRRFQKRRAGRIRFFAYVQWLCELQLNELGRTARKSSLSLGLYQDLPVGIHPDGADAWAFQDQLAQDISVGAPPDSFNLKGQSWGLLSPSPHMLRKHRYQFLIHTFRNNMRHAGVLRIDHALGLFRMFWIPQGKTGQEGVYVRTFVDEILAVLALESVRHRVVVVGEDLGTVTPAIRQKLDEAGLLSYRLLLFERQDNGDFQEPSRYPEQALVAATTHDLPTLRGYWEGRDIAVKERAGLYPHPEDIQRDLREREQDRNRLWEKLRRHGLQRAKFQPEALSAPHILAIYRYLAKTPSRLLMVQLEDLLGELETPNLPGAPDSAYPSWRNKLSRMLDDWLQDPAVIDFSKSVKRGRGAPGATTKYRGKNRK